MSVQKILLDNNYIPDYTFVNEGMNTIGYDSISEVFFDVFEIKINNVQLVKEKRGSFNGSPIIELDVRIKDEVYKDVRFVLSKDKGIKINPNLFDYTKVVVYENTHVIKEPPKPKPVVKPKPTPKPVVVEKKVPKVDPVLNEEHIIQKAKKRFYDNIKNEIVEEIKVDIFDILLNEDDNKNKLHKIIESFNKTFRGDYIDLAEKIAKREALRFAESGGGTNAVQYAEGGTMNGDLTVTGQIESEYLISENVSVDSLHVAHNLDANNILVYDSLSAVNEIHSNYGEFNNLKVNNDLSVLNDASISNNLTVGGGVSSYNGSYILGDVVVTGNLTVSQEIFGDLVSGNTIVNTNGDTLLTKMVKNINGASFVNGNYIVHHNLNSYDLLMTLYYINPENNSREVVHASMINDTLSTTQISFGSQPPASDNYKLIIMS